MRVAILGLGIIGQAWAANLRADGDALALWNRTPRGLAGEVGDPATAARGAEVVIIVVADPPAVDGVVERILPVLAPGQLIVQCSTVDPACNRRAAERVRARGADFLEAPFTGSKPAAEARQTVFYCAGDAAVLERARPVLARLAKAILRIGDIGSAATLKLAMNLNIAGVAQVLTESLRLARAAGIDDDTYFAALKLNASRSGVVDLKEPKLRSRDWRPQFSIKHMHKDLRLAAGQPGADRLRLLADLVGIYARGIEAGWSDDDFISLIRLVEGA